MSIGMTLATLPVGYRPGVASYITLWKQNVYNTPSLALIGTDGIIKCDEQSSALFTAGSWTFYGSFRAEN
jgi:hypothetical protein